MEKIFTWTGFICLTVVVIASAFYLAVALVGVALNRGKLFERMFKIIADFYKSFPRKNRTGMRYAITVYDYEQKRFVSSIFADDHGRTEEEVRVYWDSVKESISKKKE